MAPKFKPSSRAKGKQTMVEQPIMECANPEFQRVYDSDKNHPILKTHAYDFLDLSNHGFKDVGSLLDFQGWKKFCTPTFAKACGGIDFEMVRLFYANLSISRDRLSFDTYLQGRSITITAYDIQCFLTNYIDDENLGYNGNGCKIDYEFKDSTISNYKSKESVKELLQEEFKDVSKPSTTHLTRDNRLLAHILRKVIVPTDGSLTTLSTVIIAILYCLKNKILMNLPHLILHHIIRTKSITAQHYPYGALITFMMRTFYHLTPSRALDMNIDVYDHTQLKNMFFYDHSTGTWEFSPRNFKRSRPSISSANVESSSTNPNMERGPFDEERFIREITALLDTRFANFTPNTSSSFSMEASVQSLVHSMNDLSHQVQMMREAFQERNYEMERKMLQCELRLEDFINMHSDHLRQCSDMLRSFGDILRHGDDRQKAIYRKISKFIDETHGLDHYEDVF